MKREDVIRIAKEAGAWGNHTEHAVPYYLTQFANLVEQATLERAAKHFEERCVFEMSNGNHVAKEIRTLKDSHE